MRILHFIMILATLTVIQLSCKEKTMSVNKNEINDLSKELSLKEGQPKVKVISQQSPEHKINDGSTIELKAVEANKTGMGKPSSPQYSNAPQSRTNAPASSKSQSTPSTRSTASPGSKFAGSK